MESASDAHSGNGNRALTRPLSYTGTAEELEAELGPELAGCVGYHQALGSTLGAAKAQMGAAAKAVREEGRKKAGEGRKKQGSADLRL
jgi:PRTRC genetic system protein E